MGAGSLGGRRKCLMVTLVRPGLSKEGLWSSRTAGEKLPGTMGNKARPAEAKMGDCKGEITIFFFVGRGKASKVLENF